MAKRGRKPIHNLSQISCTNPYCRDTNKTGLQNIVSNGTYMTQTGKGQRFRCKTCGMSFCRKSGTIFKGFRTQDQKVISAIKLLAKGMTIRKTASILEIKPDTLRHWLALMASQSENVNKRLSKEKGVSNVELESLWNWVRSGALRERAIQWRKKCGWWQGWKDS